MGPPIIYIVKQQSLRLRKNSYNIFEGMFQNFSSKREIQRLKINSVHDQHKLNHKKINFQYVKSSSNNLVNLPFLRTVNCIITKYVYVDEFVGLSSLQHDCLPKTAVQLVQGERNKERQQNELVDQSHGSFESNSRIVLRNSSTGWAPISLD